LGKTQRGCLQHAEREAPTCPVTVQNLSDAGQAHAIDFIAKDAGKADVAWRQLSKSLTGPQGGTENRDPYRVDRILVATVAKGLSAMPADRLLWTRVFVKPINFKFAGYTIAATENETVKISSVEATNVRKLSADIGLAIPGMDGSKIGLAPSSERTVKTTSDVSAQYERLGVDIMPTFLRIIRESGAGGDVIGNTTVALSMTTDPEMILADKNLTPPEPDIHLVVTGVHLDDDNKEPSVDVLPVVPLPHCALRAKISAIYEQRHVQTGREFYDESRQEVFFIHDVFDERTVELIGADDVSPFVWSIQLVPMNETPKKLGTHPTLNARFSGVNAPVNSGGSWRQLVFSDYGRAVTLAHWVRTHSGKRASGYEFNWTEGTGLAVVKRTTDDCIDAEIQAQ
jgi:hypothetical protein